MGTEESFAGKRRSWHLGEETQNNIRGIENEREEMRRLTFWTVT